MHGARAAGAPFIHYAVVDMAAQMDVELGVPLASALSGDERVSAGIIPASGYASPVYSGVKNGIKANKALLDRAAKNGIQWDRWDDENGKQRAYWATRSPSFWASVSARRCMST